MLRERERERERARERERERERERKSQKEREREREREKEKPQKQKWVFCLLQKARKGRQTAKRCQQSWANCEVAKNGSLRVDIGGKLQQNSYLDFAVVSIMFAVPIVQLAVQVRCVEVIASGKQIS